MFRRLLQSEIAGWVGLGWLLLALSLLTGCAPTPRSASPAVRIKLLLFVQDNCLPCKLLKAQLTDGAVADIIGSFDVVEVTPPDPRFDEYGITATPALVALTARGGERYPGGTLGQLRLWLFEVKEGGSPEAVVPVGSAPAAAGKISEGGPTSPDNRVAVVCDLPASERKKNIASKGLGCCVFRSIEYAARWVQVSELYDLPEQMVRAGIPGGGFPAKVDSILKQFGPDVQYVQDTSGDPAILEAILKSGRLPCVTYNGHDCHYSGTIAHMVCLPYFDRSTGWACVSDNNFPGEDSFVWLSCDEFLQRWKGGGGSGWVVALLACPPPPVPHNR